jgi:hypothetical protein
MRTRCKYNPDKPCNCQRKLGWRKWLYLLPIAWCAIFSTILIDVEKNYQDKAYTALSEDNHNRFKIIHNIAINTIPEYEKVTGNKALELFTDSIVPKLTNSSFTFGFTHPTENLTDPILHEVISKLDPNLDVIEHDMIIPNLGKARVFRYEQRENTYWVFGTHDGNLIKYKRNNLALIVFISLLGTAGLNLWVIHNINKYATLREDNLCTTNKV